jgi:hypothetical protein
MHNIVCVFRTLRHFSACICRRGHLDRFKMPESRFKQWEDTILANFARREGWVVGQAATGSDAWNNTSVRLDV